jgi:SAM-dependent methyltransferase
VLEQTAAPFTSLARVYDRIMADIEYDEWVDFVLHSAARRGFRGGAVLDLGCGTGNGALQMLQRGQSVQGLDGSKEMLAVAKAKLPGVKLHLGSFETFRLPASFQLIYSLFDSLNNLLTPEAFHNMARRVHHHLLPGGLFIFDVNTPAGLRELWRGGVAEGWADDVYYRWENSYDAKTGLAQVTAYCDTPDGAFTEVHHERGYDEVELRRLLGRAGFEAVEVLAHPDGGRAQPDSDRLWVLAERGA